MIPIRDTIRSRHTPYVTYMIVAINVMAFFSVNLSLPPRSLNAFFQLYGILPVRYSHSLVSHQFTLLEQVLPFLTSMFLHGGFLHIVGNMWVLWIFGDNVEDWFGHLPFALFYLFCGVTSGLIHLFFNWGSQLPTIGASGAIAGVMGAYFLLYPHARILTLIPIFIFLQFMELPAYIFLGFWFLLQFLSGTASAGAGGAGGLAWWAHLGGFAVGAAVVFLLGGGKPRRPARSRPTMKPLWDRVDEYWR
jgi:membrane associated rhomboid family serine protease